MWLGHWESFFFWLHPRHGEIPELGIAAMPQQ